MRGQPKILNKMEDLKRNIKRNQKQKIKTKRMKTKCEKIKNQNHESNNKIENK